MKFIPVQCRVCPFRPASAPGWLGSYSVADVFNYIWKGQPFFCHSTINYRNPGWLKRAMKVGKLCTGGLVFADKILAPPSEYPQIVEGRRLVRALAGIECLDVHAFQARHTRDA